MIDRLEFLKRALMAPIAAAAGIRMANAEEPDQLLIGPADDRLTYTPSDASVVLRDSDRWKARWGPHVFSGYGGEIEVVNDSMDFDSCGGRRCTVQGLRSAVIRLQGIGGDLIGTFGECHNLQVEETRGFNPVSYELVNARIVEMHSGTSVPGPILETSVEFRGGELRRLA